MAGFGRLQIFGGQRERGAQQIHPAAIQHAEIERHEQPLVRIDDERVRAGAALERVAALRHDRRDTAVRAVDVQPQIVALADIRNRRHRIDARRRRAANRRDHRDRQIPVGDVLRDRGVERVGPHAEVIVRGNVAHGIVAVAKKDHRFIDGVVRMLRAINAYARDVGASAQSLRPHAGHFHLARGGERVQRGDRRGVVDHAVEG